MNDENVDHYAEVFQKLGRAGASGALTMVKVRLLNNNSRTLVRAVLGQVAVGDILALRECDREHRRMR